MDQPSEPHVPQPRNWRDGLDPRMRKHVAFCQDYAANHNHGAPGHLDYLTIDTLAAVIDVLDSRIAEIQARYNTLIGRPIKGGG